MFFSCNHCRKTVTRWTGETKGSIWLKRRWWCTFLCIHCTPLPAFPSERVSVRHMSAHLFAFACIRAYCISAVRAFIDVVTKTHRGCFVQARMFILLPAFLWRDPGVVLMRGLSGFTKETCRVFVPIVCTCVFSYLHLCYLFIYFLLFLSLKLVNSLPLDLLQFSSNPPFAPALLYLQSLNQAWPVF